MDGGGDTNMNAMGEDNDSDDYVDDEELMDDDEGTLDEEEGLEDDEENELAALNEENGMSIEELLKRYSRPMESISANINPEAASTSSSHPQDAPSTSNPPQNNAASSGEHGYFSASDESEDEDYEPPEAVRKEIRVGDEYQACISQSITEELNENDVLIPEDSLLWKPEIADAAVVSYLREVYSALVIEEMNGVNNVPPANILLKRTDDTVPDNEDALYLLFKCAFHSENAMAAHKAYITQNGPKRAFIGSNADERVGGIEEQGVKPVWGSSMPPWSEQDCRAFEEGLRLYGKDFNKIHRQMLSCKRRGDLVHFYYIWKKTERHDLFIERVRMEKEQYLVHPHATDLMDHYIDNIEKGVEVSNPQLVNSTTLMSSDPKHAHGATHATHYDIPQLHKTGLLPVAQEDGTVSALPGLEVSTVDKILNST